MTKDGHFTGGKTKEAIFIIPNLTNQPKYILWPKIVTEMMTDGKKLVLLVLQ